MVIIPKERPIIESLNSYYIDVYKLIEHYQGELGSGAVHFHAPSAEGAIFFDKDEILGGIYDDREGETNGREAVRLLIESAVRLNYHIGVYSIDPEKIYFWADLSSAETLYKDLSAEFTDLNGLIKKMVAERLTGYVQVSIDGDKEEGGIIFFINGEIIGGARSGRTGQLDRSDEIRNRLIRKVGESGGTFQVCRISLKRAGEDKSLPFLEEEPPADILLSALEELLVLLEETVASSKSIKASFNTQMKKKFIELADTYAFLDPFAAEFEYANRRIRYTGDAGPEQLASAILESVKSLSKDLGIEAEMKLSRDSWERKYAPQLARLGISI